MNPAVPFPELARAAALHLAAVEPRFGPLIAAHGSCTLTPDPDLFRGLVRAVIAQLISTAAARSIFTKYEASLGNALTPERVLARTDDEMRACGLSAGKRKTIRGVAERFASTPGLSATLLATDDAAVRAALLPLHGVGPWTVEMLLIFGLGRPDVWPVGDLGVRLAVQDIFKMRKLPDAKRLHKLAKPWSPYRTFAAWYLWCSRESPPE